MGEPFAGIIYPLKYTCIENRQHNLIIIIILGALTAIGPFSIDLYLPGFPAIADSLHTNIAKVGLSLTSFFIGISFGQLIIGPLSDRYGRKKPLVAGLILYIIASLGCMASDSLNALVAMRLLQALGGCAGMVLSRAMVRDLFPPLETPKIFSMLMLVMGVAPVIAPTLGGMITATAGWRYMFLALTVIGAMLLAGAWYLPESRQADAGHSLHPAQVLKNYIRIGKVPWFLSYTATAAFAGAGMFAYITGSPFVFMKLFGLSQQQYGWIFGLNAAGLIAASQLNRLWLAKRSSQRIIAITGALQLATGILLAAGTAFRFMHTTGTLLCVFAYLFLYGFIFPNGTALALQPFPRHAGSASALLGSIQMVAGALASALVSYFDNGTALPMSAVIAGCAAVSFAAARMGQGLATEYFE